MIQFRQRLDLSWMGKSHYYPPLWWRRWGRKVFIVGGIAFWPLAIWLGK